MSEALYPTGGLRFWSEREILLREQFVARLFLAVRDPLTALNPAWQFRRVEGPVVTPRPRISPEYADADLWTLGRPVGTESAALRAETTASSYLYAHALLQRGDAKLPLCVWQHGKSFRAESNDGATPSQLRFNEFYQLEFQCAFKTDSKADYLAAVLPAVAAEIGRAAGLATRVVPSDRLPSYSRSTTDVECHWKAHDWKEAASVSLRTDFPVPGVTVLEVAVGTDRLVCFESREFSPDWPPAPAGVPA